MHAKHETAEHITYFCEATFDQVVLQEDIREGERVRSYVLEAKVHDTWSTIAKGSCIGHKRIHKLGAPMIAGKIRLKIESSTAKPIISSLAIYLTNQGADGTEPFPPDNTHGDVPEG